MLKSIKKSFLSLDKVDGDSSYNIIVLILAIKHVNNVYSHSTVLVLKKYI